MAILHQINTETKNRNKKDFKSGSKSSAISVLMKKMMPENSEKQHYKSVETLGYKLPGNQIHQFSYFCRKYSFLKISLAIYKRIKRSILYK